MAFFHSKPVHYGLILALAAAVVGVNCERADGPPFSALAIVDPAAAHVYLYRRGALAAYGQGFDIHIDGKPGGRLVNASYLMLSLAPGRHVLQVAPGAKAARMEAEIVASAGTRAFYEVVFPTGLDMRPDFKDALIARREQAEAVLALCKLREKAFFLVQDAK